MVDCVALAEDAEGTRFPIIGLLYHLLVLYHYSIWE